MMRILANSGNINRTSCSFEWVQTVNGWPDARVAALI